MAGVRNLTQVEAARQLGCPEGTLSGRLSRARQRLRERLARRGLAPTSAALAAPVSAGLPPTPAALNHATIRAALQLAAGHAPLAGTVPARVAELAGGVLVEMSRQRMLTALAVCFAVAVLFAGGGLPLFHSIAPKATADEKVAKAELRKLLG